MCTMPGIVELVLSKKKKAIIIIMLELEKGNQYLSGKSQ